MEVQSFNQYTHLPKTDISQPLLCSPSVSVLQTPVQGVLQSLYKSANVHCTILYKTVYRKKYQWEKVPSGVWYFFLRKKYHIGTFSYWYIFLYNRKKYHNISIVIGKSTIWFQCYVGCNLRCGLQIKFRNNDPKIYNYLKLEEE